jgi:flagellar biosynthesis protein FliQ
MTEPVLLDLLRQALWVALIISLPILTVALAVGPRRSASSRR